MNVKDRVNGFLLQNKDNWEEKTVMVYCILNKIPYKFDFDGKVLEKGWIPVGSVQWVSNFIGHNVIPDYFPAFMSKYITRNIWYTDILPIDRNVFIKPSDVYKRFNGIESDKCRLCIPEPPYVCSDIVNFVNEFRYYVLNGKIIHSSWYVGIDDVEISTPELNVDIPSNWCGTIDMGITDAGKFELIECHHPFSCGWYGKNYNVYCNFLVDGWNYISNNR